MREVSGGRANLEIFSVVECDGFVVRYDFVGRVDSKSILMAINLFQSLTQYKAFNFSQH